jgi:hypothetical protein
MPGTGLLLRSGELRHAEQDFYDWVYTQSPKSYAVYGSVLSPGGMPDTGLLLRSGELRHAEQDFYDWV